MLLHHRYPQALRQRNENGVINILFQEFLKFRDGSAQPAGFRYNFLHFRIFKDKRFSSPNLDRNASTRAAKFAIFRHRTSSIVAPKFLVYPFKQTQAGQAYRRSFLPV